MMRIKLLPKGDIYKVNFGYRSKMGGYTMSMLDIPNLAAMLGLNLGIPCGLPQGYSSSVCYMAIDTLRLAAGFFISLKKSFHGNKFPK